MKRMTRERFLSDAELEAFMGAVRARQEHRNHARDYAMFALLATSGIRPSEALRLTRTDVHPHGSPPWIRVSRLKKKNASKVVDELQLPESLARVIGSYLETREWQPDDRIFWMTRRQAQRLFQWYAQRAGIKGRRLYVLRHTAATRIYRATRDIKVVQALLGHESPETSAIYAHVPQAVLKEAAELSAVI